MSTGRAGLPGLSGLPGLGGIARAGGMALGTVFGATALLRRSKPLHPEGAVAGAVLTVTPVGARFGVPLLDTPDVHDCLVRASYAVGTGPDLPDIEGFAIRVRSSAGEPGEDDREDAGEEILFASTGAGAVTRHLLLVRAPGTHATQTTLLPVRAGGRPLVLRLEPVDGGTQPWPTAYELFWAQGRGPWHRWARLDVAWGEPADALERFDPVAHPLRGTTQYAVVARLREPAYRLSQRAWPR